MRSKRVPPSFSICFELNLLDESILRSDWQSEAIKLPVRKGFCSFILYYYNFYENTLFVDLKARSPYRNRLDEQKKNKQYEVSFTMFFYSRKLSMNSRHLSYFFKLWM